MNDERWIELKFENAVFQMEIDCKDPEAKWHYWLAIGMMANIREEAIKTLVFKVQRNLATRPFNRPEYTKVALQHGMLPNTIKKHVRIFKSHVDGWACEDLDVEFPPRYTAAERQLMFKMNQILKRMKVYGHSK